MDCNGTCSDEIALMPLGITFGPTGDVHKNELTKCPIGDYNVFKKLFINDMNIGFICIVLYVWCVSKGVLCVQYDGPVGC